MGENTLLYIIIFFLISSAVWILSIIDLLKNKYYKDSTEKLIWTTLILFTHILGSVLYYTIGPKKISLKSSSEKIPGDFIFVIILNILILINLIFNYKYYSSESHFAFTVITGYVSYFIYYIYLFFNLMSIYVIIKRKKWGWMILNIFNFLMAINAIIAMYSMFVYALKSHPISVSPFIVALLITFIPIYIFVVIYRRKKYFIN